jgi:hypothetical protein
MDFKILNTTFRHVIDSAFEYVTRESGKCGVFEGLHVWWGADVEGPDLQLDVKIKFLNAEGQQMHHTELQQVHLEAIARGYKRLYVWREGGSFPGTVAELFSA